MNKNIKIVYIISVTVVIILLNFASCSISPDNGRALDREIKSALKNSPGIDLTEWQKINDLINKEDLLKEQFSSDEILESHIRSVAQEIYESGRSEIELPISIEKKKIGPGQKRKYNIYLENSGSMYGYLAGNTAFKDALMDLCSRFRRKEESINFFFVNDQIHPIEGKLEDFMKYLRPDKLRRIGNIGSSNVGDILDMVLDSVVSKKEVAILSSDFIFSLKNSKDIENQLTTQKYGITNIIVQHQLKKDGYGFLIIQGRSLFDGYYYDFKNKQRRIKKDRPYYTWIIAPVDKILKFENDYDIKSLRGYQNHATIFDSKSLDIPYFSILAETGKIGDFRKKDRKSAVIKEITNISYDHRKERSFQFSVAIDLSMIPVYDDYFIDAGNYSIESSQGNEFAFKIVPISSVDINNRDEKLIKSSTHIVQISSSSISTGDQELVFSLKKVLPSWLQDASTLDDADIEETSTQTFGLEYLVAGIVDAFKPVAEAEAEEFYFRIPIKINR